MMPLVMPKKTTAAWMEVSRQFMSRWHFPNCLGAIDGKHCTTIAPRKSGSMYYSYKKSFSTVLMAAVDADYKFIMVDIGAYGANHDSTVFANSMFGRLWLKRDPILKNSPLPLQNISMPYKGG